MARIFNTCGPKMRPEDGRMIPNFIARALAGKHNHLRLRLKDQGVPQYIDDLVEGIIR